MNKKYLCKIDKKYNNILKKNPHTIHFFCDIKNIKKFTNKNEKGYFYERDHETKDLIETNIKLEDIESRYYQNEIKEILDNDSKFLDYLDRRQRPTTSIHWGQLKLFLSTLQFLLYYAPRSEKVHIIYPGSADGTNINILTRMFPQCYWYLIDPRPHYKALYNNPKVIEVRDDYFTEDTALEYKNRLKGKFILLISDIRIEPTEESIHKTNLMQQEWIRIINPEYSQLKFRPPRTFKKYKYLDGKIYFQIYAAQATTETRLVVKKDAKLIDYDVEDYEGKCYYHNRVTRVSNYKHDIKHSKSYIDNCFDCVSFLLLLDKYVKKYKKVFEHGKIKDSSIDYLIDFIISRLSNKNKLEEDTKRIIDNLNFKKIK
jgi:hypothetical protein